MADGPLGSLNDAPQSSDDSWGFGTYGTAKPELPRIANDLDYQSLAGGAKFIDPEGKERIKPYKVTGDADYFNVPEGATFTDPEGNVRAKPKGGGMGFTINTLYNMALTPEAKNEVLQRYYGPKAKLDVTGPYVEQDDGTVLRPGARDIPSGLGIAASETLPALGGLGGMVVGAAGGTGVPGAGTAAGGFLGGTLGAMAGKQANNFLMSLLGYHQPVGEQVSSLGREGAMVAGGEVLGRAAGAGLNALVKTFGPAQVQRLSQMAGSAEDVLRGFENGDPRFFQWAESVGATPRRVAEFLGATPETLERIASVNAKGARVPPSAAFPKSPYLGKVEQFHRTFTGDQNIFETSAREMYEREGADILTNPGIGGTLAEPLTQSTKAVSGDKAGNLAIETARMRMQQADMALDAAVEGRKQAVLNQYGGDPQAAAAGVEAQRVAFQRAYDDNIKAANNLVQQGINAIAMDADQAVAQGGGGNLINNIANSFRSLSDVVRGRARRFYQAWGDAAGNIDVDATPLRDQAREFLDLMPPGIQAKYPMEMRMLQRMQGEMVEDGVDAAGQPIMRELPIQISAADLHNLRSWMRYGIDYEDIAPNMREGFLRNFEHRVDAALRSISETPEGARALPLLDKADAFYRDNVPYLNNAMIKETMKQLRGGTGIDPEVAAGIFFKSGRAEDVREARRVLGPNLWNAIEGAHIRQIARNSRNMDGTMDAKKFADFVERDFRNGMLETGYSAPKAGQMVNQATDIRKLAADLKNIDGNLPIQMSTNDDIRQILMRAQAAKQHIDATAKLDPLGSFQSAVKEIDDAAKQVRANIAAERKESPLHFLMNDNMTYRASQAAEHILSSPDTILAAAKFYGNDSPTFNALRQLYVRKLLQRDFGRTGNIRHEMGVPGSIHTEEVQALMFPGVTRAQMQDLAKNMEFLFGSHSLGGSMDAGGSLAAASRVLHPSRGMPWYVRALSKIPVLGEGVESGLRAAMGNYYRILMQGVSNPAFINWLTRGLNGPPAEREAVRQAVRTMVEPNKRVGYGQALGNLGGNLAGSATREEPRAQPPETNYGYQ